MSVSSDSNRMVYSVFQNDKYAIYSIDSADVLKGYNIQPDFATGDPSLLPPSKQINNTFVNNLNNPKLGLPSDTASYLITDYSPSLKVVGVGQPYIGAGADPFGTFVGGGIALFWSDLLGNQNLITALQVSAGSQITYISGLVGYMNTESRLNWGGVIQQVPYFYTYYGEELDTVNGQLADVQKELIYQETDREVAGLITYPLSEASRIEYSLGYRNIGFTAEVLTQAYSYDGSLIENETQKTSLGDINLATTSLAYVFDNSYYGATGPLIGSRYRFEVSPNYGNITWTDILADYRIYVMPVKPFTVAARVLSYGRYGKDAEDDRLTPEFLGYPGLVRGYDINSYSDDSYTNLEGSKILIGNLELRFPLLGTFGIGPGFYGYFPIEFAGFYDTGVAWYNDERPSILPGGDRMPVSSTGLCVRVNLFGYAVGEVDYVHPYNHGDTKSVWEFNLLEGF